MQICGTIFDIKRYAIHDGPGIRTTVFLKGCPLRCPWCHNPESWLPTPEPALRVGRCRLCGACVEACSAHATRRVNGRIVTDEALCIRCGRCVEACLADARRIIGREITVAEVLAELARDVIFFDESGGGATFSGGEPLMQPRFLAECLRACQKQGIRTAVDTTLHAQWDHIAAIIAAADIWLCDLKHMDSQIHRQVTGVGNELILANLRQLAAVAPQIIIRVPIIPGFNDGVKNVQATGTFVSSLGRVRQIDLLKYNRHGIDKAARLSTTPEMFTAQPLTDGQMQAIAEQLGSFGLEVRVVT